MSKEKNSERWLAVDMLRFIAVLLMVQGHTFTVVMTESVYGQYWYRLHNYVHGFTAPMFLFASGVAFGLTTYRNWSQHLVLSSAFFKRIRRYLWIILVGYALHCPNTSIIKAFSAIGPDKLSKFLLVDALQQIGVTLLMCELSVLVLRSKRIFTVWVIAFGSIVVFAAPWVASWPGEHHLPLWAASYINRTTGSIFPIFPWSGFVLMGVASAYWVENWVLRIDESKGPVYGQIGGRLACLGGLLALLSWFADHSSVELFPPHVFWKESPIFFGWRLGVLWVVLGSLCWLQSLMPRAHQKHRSFGVELMQVAASHTLLIYVIHLLLLYGSPIQAGLIHFVGKRLMVFEASGIAFAMVAAMLLLAMSWHMLQKKRPIVSIWMQIPIVISAFYFFFLG